LPAGAGFGARLFFENACGLSNIGKVFSRRDVKDLKKYKYELQTGFYDRCAKPDYKSAGFYDTYEEAEQAGKEWDAQKTGLSNYNAHRIITHEVENLV